MPILCEHSLNSVKTPYNTSILSCVAETNEYVPYFTKNDFSECSNILYCCHYRFKNIEVKLQFKGCVLIVLKQETLVVILI